MVDVAGIAAMCPVCATDGIRLGAAQGLYEDGPLHGHLLIHGPADRPRATAIYLIPLWALHHHRTGEPVYLSVPASYARRRWLIDIIDDT